MKFKRFATAILSVVLMFGVFSCLNYTVNAVKAEEPTVEQSTEQEQTPPVEDLNKPQLIVIDEAKLFSAYTNYVRGLNVEENKIYETMTRKDFIDFSFNGFMDANYPEQKEDIIYTLNANHGTVFNWVELMIVKEDASNPPAVEPEMPVEPAEPDFVELFITHLKETYGEDYQKIYDKIIAEWGSVEEYLLNFGYDYLPEQYHAGWNQFVGWLNENASIWATVLAIAALIFISIFGKKAFDKIINKVVNEKLTPIIQEMNKYSNALGSIAKATSMIVPKTEEGNKIAEELKDSDKDLKNQK